MIVCCYFVKVIWATECFIWVSTLEPCSESVLLPTAWKCCETTGDTHRENNIKRVSSEVSQKKLNFHSLAKRRLRGYKITDYKYVQKKGITRITRI